MKEGLLVRPRSHRRPSPRPVRRVVRTALLNEAAVLSVLHHALARDTVTFDAAIRAEPVPSGALMLVCEVSESIAGYLCLGAPDVVLDLASPAHPGEWTLCAFGVAPQFRRTGVATDLWRAALAAVPESISVVTSSTHTDLAAAVAWFDAHGFAADRAVATPSATEADNEITFRAEVVALRAHLDAATA